MVSFINDAGVPSLGEYLNVKALSNLQVFTTSRVSSKSSSVSSEINLLGYTVDEAIAVLDKYLDDAYIAKIPQVRIVHGKGTGALRSGITSYLRGIPYIKEFRLGQIGEGAEGVTIVTFKD